MWFNTCLSPRNRAMLRFLLTRISLVIPTFIGMTLLAFFLIRIVPGDPIETMAGARARRQRHPRGAPKGLRHRSAHPCSVRDLHRPRAPRRPREVDDHAGAGAERIPGAFSR